MERTIERLLFASRWILAPVYLGMSLALLALGVKFFMELGHMFTGLLEIAESDLVLGLLALVDMALVGSLIVMVMFSGYENFASCLDVDAGTEKLSWLGKLDANSLKLKVASSIVAISSIHLLRQFMSQAKMTDVRETELMWYVIIHLTFVVSAVMMGVLDRVTSGQKHGHRGEV